MCVYTLRPLYSCVAMHAPIKSVTEEVLVNRAHHGMCVRDGAHMHTDHVSTFDTLAIYIVI